MYWRLQTIADNTLLLFKIFFQQTFCIEHVVLREPRRNQSNHRLHENRIWYSSDSARTWSHNLFCYILLHYITLHSIISQRRLHMSDHHLAKGLSLSSVHDFGIHNLPIPEIRILYQLSIPGSKHTSSKLHSLPRLFPISLDCLPGFWFLLFSFYALSNDT